jgi:copper homeostasis protein (lipoprotein)
MLALPESRPRARLVRHNRPVTAAARRWSFLFVALVAAAVAGCDGGGSGDANAPATTFDSPDAELAWEGTLACADCDGIETRLRLQHGNGVVAQYELVEAFLAGDATEYFREQGRWRRDGRILRLQSSSGGERLYAIDGAGNLVVVDRRGHAAGAGRTLSPVGPPKL